MNLSKPIFVLTSDQDWAPAWAVESFLQATIGIPVHMFRTNPCPVADNAFATGKITQGWHPNLLPNSSHGSNQEEIVNYMLKNFPNCNTARCHTYLTNTHFDKLLFESGVKADSQLATLHQENLYPLNDISGITRFPVFFEDDVFFRLKAPNLELKSMIKHMFSPGLKIFNLHPTFIACNTPSEEHYSEFRDKIFNSLTPNPSVVFQGKGSASIFREIKELVLENGYSFSCFQNIVDELPKL